MASSVPVGSHGVLLTPWLNGERSPVDDHTIRGGFHNLSLSSSAGRHGPGRVRGRHAEFRLVARGGGEILQTHVPLPRLGRGRANSDLWSQGHADATGRTVRQIEDPVLANVRGAGLLTLLALGYLTIDDIPGTVTVRATYEPDPAPARSTPRCSRSSSTCTRRPRPSTSD